MRPYWGCPVCGKKSSRRWNAERHIKEVHKLGDQPIKHEQDGLSQQVSMQVPYNPSENISQQRHNISEYGIVIGFPDLNDHSWTSKARRIIDRTIEAYPGDLRIELYNGSPEYGSSYQECGMIVGYSGNVCERCLSIFLSEVSMERTFIRGKHRCQVGHMRYSQGIGNRGTIIDQLYVEELPMLMSILIEGLENKLGMSRYLFAKPIESLPEFFIDIDANNIGGSTRLGTVLLSQGSPISDSEMRTFFRQSGFYTWNNFRVRMPLGGPIYYDMGIALADRRESMSNSE